MGRHCVFLFLVFTLLLTACGSPNPTATLVPTLAPTWLTLIPSYTATAEPSPTPPATFTATPSATATPTPPPTASPTPLIPPTATPDPNDSFVLAVCGDSRGGDEVYRQILSRAVADDSDFLVHLGDIVHEGQLDQFEHVRDLMAEYPLTVLVVPGNHDTLNGSLDNFMNVFEPPPFPYSFDRGQVHLVMLDSSWGVLVTEQLAWLDADLAASAQPVTMVFVHHPPFDPVGTDHIMAAGQEAFMELMKQHGVDYVFAGHIHSFDYALRDGTHYYITGGAGAPLYPHYQRDAFYHYLRVGVQGSEVSVELVRLDEP